MPFVDHDNGSRHSWRMVPITRSAMALACGARMGASTVSLPIAVALRTKSRS